MLRLHLLRLHVLRLHLLRLHVLRLHLLRLHLFRLHLLGLHLLRLHLLRLHVLGLYLLGLYLLGLHLFRLHLLGLHVLRLHKLRRTSCAARAALHKPPLILILRLLRLNLSPHAWPQPQLGLSSGRASARTLPATGTAGLPQQWTSAPAIFPTFTIFHSASTARKVGAACALSTSSP